MPVPGLEEVNLFQTPFPFGGAFLKALLMLRSDPGPGK